jgi:hypothetical protein
MSTASVLMQSFVATGVSNLDSSRFRNAPLDTRKEGWTEAWGDPKKAEDPDWKLDDESVAKLLSTPHPQLPITLVQYRPAWLEQLALRMAKIPHIVLNAEYVTNEATGPLPYMKDIQPSKQPVLVGREHPSSIHSNNAPCQNSIIDHLRSNRGVDLDSHLSQENKALSKCFTTLIQSELRMILLFLRYEDLDAWEQVYRGQCLQATHSRKWLAQMGGRFQAWSERAVGRRHLGDAARTLSIPKAEVRAKEAYETFETQLSKHDAPFLLGGSQPSLVDALLWDHLADALCDVHLVTVLSESPKLVTYFSNIHTVYFASSNQDEWNQWNRRQNLGNAFQQLPMEEKTRASKAHFKDAIELMQSLSVHKHELQEVLTVAKQKREAEPWPTTESPTKANFYRWRMGDTFSAPEEEDPAAQDNPQRQKLVQERSLNDQRWLSGVVGVSALAVLFLQGFQRET